MKEERDAVMRFKQFLAEAIFDRENGIHHNPTSAEVEALYKKRGDLRGIHSRKHGVFLWRSRDFTHSGVASYLKRQHGVDVGPVSYENHDPERDGHGFHVDKDEGHGHFAAWSHHDYAGQGEEKAILAHRDLKARLAGSSMSKTRVMRPTKDKEYD